MSSQRINLVSLALTSALWLSSGNELENNWIHKKIVANVTSRSKPICNIAINAQNDGLGQNLNSLLSLLDAHGKLTLSGKSELYYDATFHSYSMYYKEHSWQFAGLTPHSEENYLAFAYYVQVQRLFAKYHRQSPRLYSEVTPPLRDIWQFYYEEPCKVDSLYQISNAFYLEQERNSLIRRFFVDNNKLLPPSRLNQEVHSLVVHIRLDGESYYDERQVFLSVSRIIRILRARYLGNVDTYIHTDRSREFVENQLGFIMWEKAKRKITVVGRNDTNVLQLISDMAYCDTFVGTPASLSYLGSYLTKAKDVFGAGGTAFNLMAPRAEDLENYLEFICEGNWQKCDGKMQINEADHWVWKSRK